MNRKHIILLITVAVLSIILGSLLTNAKSHYVKYIQLMPDSCYLKNVGDSIATLRVEARVAVVENKERAGESKSKWRLVWNYKSQNDFNYVELTWRNTDFGDFADSRQAVVNVVEVKNGIENALKTVAFDRNLDLSVGYNSLLVEASDGKYTVFAGGDKYVYIGTFSSDEFNQGQCGVMSTVLASVSNFVVETTPDYKRILQTQYSTDTLDRLFNSDATQYEGYWTYLDRNNDPDRARVGGRYRLALVKEDNDYLIIYVDGATTNACNWREGMIKGRLSATIFKDHYDLEWYDSMFDVIETDAHAYIENSILTLEFPLYKTQIRFSKQR